MDEFYFITTVERDGLRTFHTCVGYVKSYEEAEKIVLNNDYDIAETCYNYAVIEKIPIGIYQFDTDPKWFKFNPSEERYEKCDTPDFAKGVAGWAMN